MHVNTPYSDASYGASVSPSVSPDHWNAFQLLERLCPGEAPAAHKLHATELPQPYHRLLVHSQDMTPTLEFWFGERTGLRVLRSNVVQEHCVREVVLDCPSAGAVEYGLIRITLKLLPPMVQRKVLAGKLPLGRILQDEVLPHLSWPQGFYRFEPHPYLQVALALPRPMTLYGRRNVLLTGERQLLADVLEILSPAAEKAGWPETKPLSKGEAARRKLDL